MAYSDDLREAIRKRPGMSRRSLSFKLAGLSGNKQASEFRALGKYMKGESIPEPERARLIADAVGEPALADPPDPAEVRRGRLAELEVRVDDLEKRQTTGVAEVIARLVEVEDRLEQLTQQVDRRRKGAR